MCGDLGGGLGLWDEVVVRRDAQRHTYCSGFRLTGRGPGVGRCTMRRSGGKGAAFFMAGDIYRHFDPTAAESIEEFYSSLSMFLVT